MKIEIGTRVRFLNDVGGGIVKGFTPDEKVIVENQDGFELPVRVEELIIEKPMIYGFDGDPVHVPDEKPEKENSRVKPEISFEEKKFLSFRGMVLMALVPENEKLLHVSNFELYIINDSNYHFYYVLSSSDNNIYNYISSGTIEPDTKYPVIEYSQNTIGKIKEFRLQGFFYKQGLFEPRDPVDYNFNIADVSFYKIGFFLENDYFNQKALILKQNHEINLKEAFEKIKDEEVVRVAGLKDSPEKQVKKTVNSTTMEVDLHIEEIVENASGLSNGEIIKTQLSRFETALETAIRSKSLRVVFIHGVGNGRLKHEIRKHLDRKYPDLKYQDASFKEYGYGATMVYLK